MFVYINTNVYIYVYINIYKYIYIDNNIKICIYVCAYYYFLSGINIISKLIYVFFLNNNQKSYSGLLADKRTQFGKNVYLQTSLRIKKYDKQCNGICIVLNLLPSKRSNTNLLFYEAQN